MQEKADHWSSVESIHFSHCRTESVFHLTSPLFRVLVISEFKSEHSDKEGEEYTEQNTEVTLQRS